MTNWSRIQEKLLGCHFEAGSISGCGLWRYKNCEGGSWLIPFASNIDMACGMCHNQLIINTADFGPDVRVSYGFVQKYGNDRRIQWPSISLAFHGPGPWPVGKWRSPRVFYGNFAYCMTGKSGFLVLLGTPWWQNLKSAGMDARVTAMIEITEIPGTREWGSDWCIQAIIAMENHGTSPVNRGL